MRCAAAFADIGGWARAAIQASDAHATLAPRADARLLSGLRDCAASLPELAALERRLDTLPLPPGSVRRCRRLLRAIERDLHALQCGVPIGRRLMPWLAAMVAVMLPLPIPFHTGQRKFSSLQVAARTKDVMLLLGLLARDTSTPRAFGRHVENRVFLDLAGSAIYAAPAFIPSARHLMSEARFNIPATVAIAVSALVYFNQKMLPVMARALGLKTPGTVLSVAQQHEIEAWAEELAREKGKLESLLQNFRQSPNPAVSDNLNRLLNQLDSAFTQLLKEMARQSSGPQRSPAVSPGNSELYPKLAVALFSLMIVCSLGAFLYQEISALVDLCARGVWIFSELAKAAADSSVNLQGVLQGFKQISGLALLLVGYLAANKELGFLQSDGRRFWIGTAALSLANLTLPGPVASVASGGLGRLLAACHRRSNRAVEDSPRNAAPMPHQNENEAGQGV